MCKKAQADVFWPCIDIDIPSHPYCRKCVTKQQMEVMIQIAEMDSPSKKPKKAKTK
jgi:hypothetical protein